MKKVSVFKDFILSLAASFISTGILQLILYPFLAGFMTGEKYGIVLTIMGVANVFAAALGGSLNNTRLLVNSDYEKEGVTGDFALLNILFAFIAAGGFSIYLMQLRSISQLSFSILIVFTFLSTIRQYACVAYRIRINYKKNLILNIIIGMGELIGIFILNYTGIQELWPLAFLLGDFLGMIFLIATCPLLREPLRITSCFRTTIKIEILLLLTTLIANLLVYLDRLLLLPVLGGAAVSIYTVASFLGKSLGVVMTPLGGVLLTYYAQPQYKMTQKLFWKINAGTAVLGGFFFLSCCVLSKVVTAIFYPTLIAAATPYLLLANAAAILNVMATMTQPAVLKFAPTKWQLIIQITYAAVYIVIGIYGAKKAGVLGFCISTLIAALVRLAMLYIIGSLSLEKENEA